MNLNVTYAAKVGFWVILTAFLAITLLTYFGIITPIGKKENDYYIHFHFASIRGLTKGAKFKINGNEVGVVEKTDISPMSGVDVTVRIYDKKYLIHENAEVLITKESLLGSSYIEVTEPIGGFYEKTGERADSYYLQISTGTLKIGDLLHFVHLGEQKVIGQVESVKPLESGFDQVLIRKVDNSVQVDNTFAFVPRTKDLWDPQTKKYEKLTYLDVYQALSENTYFQGTREAGPEDLIAHVDEVVLKTSDEFGQLNKEMLVVLQQVQDLLDEVEGIIDKKAITELFDTLKTQITIVGNNIEEITTNLNQVVNENKGRIDSTMQNIETASTSLKEIATDEQTKNSIKEMAKKMESITGQIDKILADIEEITGDPEIKGDVKTSIQQAKQTLESANSTIEKLNEKMKVASGVKFSGQFSTSYRPDPDTYFSNIDLFLRVPDQKVFFTIGLNDIGESNLHNAQLGFELNPKTSARFGVRKSKIGFGMDYHLNKAFIKTDLYDPNDVIFDACAGFGISDGVYLVVGGEDIFEKDIFNLGVLYEF